MERVETEHYLRVTDELTKKFDREHSFTADDICYMHKLWLGTIYEWAGRYRHVLMSKDNFTFAAPAFIPRLMDEFERYILRSYSPCIFDSRDKIIEAIAVVHTEFVLIHPFREGNGRIARLLSALMAIQAGLPFLDFNEVSGERKEEYFAAVRAGLERNYKPMEKVFNEVISQTLKAYR